METPKLDFVHVFDSIKKFLGIAIPRKVELLLVGVTLK